MSDCRPTAWGYQLQSGDPNGGVNVRPARNSKAMAAIPLAERFDWYVDRTAGPDACWPWTGAYTSHRDPKAGSDRPVIVYKRRTLYANRVALALALGRELGSGLYACHTCDNDRCVNPAHLYEGTHADNTRDAVQRGRLYRGPKSPEWRAKIGAAQVGKTISAESRAKLSASRLRMFRDLRGA